ncbi:hypothetical protein [Celerinatantimonas sp. YJH-8]|uniref:hypothetical protein n=1 Tax=Celerinatantimonas sp. YJH-8 TaxID=3228714 RepID=UPI0038C7490B
MLIEECECLQPRLWDCEEKGTYLGADMKNSRCGDVWLYQCPECSQHWLFYRVEYPSFSKSGRWFRAILPVDMSKNIKPDAAESLLNAAPYRIVGGSFYDSPGLILTGETKLPFD